VNGGQIWRRFFIRNESYFEIGYIGDVFDFPKDGILNIENKVIKVHKAVYLDGNDEIEFAQNDNGVTLTLNPENANKYATVLALDVEL